MRHLAETLVIATAGGVVFGLAGLPAGYLSGAIVFVAIAALAGRPMHVPFRVMQAIFVFIGTSLGSVATPATLHGVATYPASVLTLIVAMAVVGWGGTAYLRHVHGWDKVSAFLAAAPGGLSQVMAVAAELDADLRGIAIVQTFRVVIVAVGLPAGMALFGLTGQVQGTLGSSFDPSQLGELLILLGVSAAVAVVAYLIRFPGGLLFGSMLASAVLHGSGFIEAVVPWWVAIAAMISLGAVIGARFANTPLPLLFQFIVAAFGSFAVACAIAAVFATGLVAAMSLRAADVMIAFAPGSVDAMLLLALALHLDPVYVGAHHLARIFFVSLTMPIIARRMANGRHARAKPRQPLPTDIPD